MNLGPQEYNSAKPQAAVVVLPEREYTFDNGEPFEGTKQYFSGNDDDLNNTMTRTLDLTGKSSASLSMKARYNIEAGFDYLFFEASLDGGKTWTAAAGHGQRHSRSPEIAAGRLALDGTSDGEWVDVTIPMDARAGQGRAVPASATRPTAASPRAASSVTRSP